MDRRKFMLGVGGSALGGSALVGSGAFTRIESQRRVKIQVAKDPHAYLGLDGCPDSPNSSYTRLDEQGHLEVEMSPDNPTDGGGKGVNSDSFTYFDNVFQICNQGKQKVGIWIGDDEKWPVVDVEKEGLKDEYEPYEGKRRVDFYLDGDDEDSLIGAENAFPLGVGECICVGIKTVTKGLEEGDQLLEKLENEIVIHADADNLGELGDRVDSDSMSITGMCSKEVGKREYYLWRVYNENEFPVNTRWECRGGPKGSGALNVCADVTRGDGDRPFVPGYYFLTEQQCDPIGISTNGVDLDTAGIDPGKECADFERDLIEYLVERGNVGNAGVCVETEDDVPEPNT